MRHGQKSKRGKRTVRIYAAKLLFQTRSAQDNDRLKRRMCEERVFIYRASDARAALRMAKAQGRALAYSYQAIAGVAHYEFVGIMELLFLDPGYMEPNEAWLDFAYRVTPMERKAKLIRPDRELHAVYAEPRTCSGRADGGPVAYLASRAARQRCESLAEV